MMASQDLNISINQEWRIQEEEANINAASIFDKVDY